MGRAMTYDVVLDEREITRQVHRYARAVDEGDREAMLAVYHPDAIEHHGTFEGPLQEYADYVFNEAHARYSKLTHYVSNVEVEVDGDVAWADCAVLGVFIRASEDDAELIDWISVRHHARFERRAGEWRIAERWVNHEWSHSETLCRLGRVPRSR